MAQGVASAKTANQSRGQDKSPSQSTAVPTMPAQSFAPSFQTTRLSATKNRADSFESRVTQRFASNSCVCIAPFKPSFVFHR